ncbi:hypothetical protein C8Q77DRAFT_1138367 [Trametes polyzona]|nr:hypothetical protein C8Q77DRAFT_1138367 [Trametes polyzona]
MDAWSLSYVLRGPICALRSPAYNLHRMSSSAREESVMHRGVRLFYTRRDRISKSLCIPGPLAVLRSDKIQLVLRRWQHGLPREASIDSSARPPLNEVLDGPEQSGCEVRFPSWFPPRRRITTRSLTREGCINKRACEHELCRAVCPPLDSSGSPPRLVMLRPIPLLYSLRIKTILSL